MAKGNLENLLKELETSAKARAAFRDTVNSYEHEYSLDYNKLWQELIAQISGLSVKDKNKIIIPIENDKALEKELRAILLGYCQTLYNKFNSLGSDPNYTVSVIGTPKKFKATVSSARKEDIFTKVIKNRVRAAALKKLQNDIYKAIDNSLLFSSIVTSAEDPGHVERTLTTRVLGREYETKRTDKNNNPVMGRTSGLFELGHLSGSSVVEKWLKTKTDSLGSSLSSLPARVLRESKVLGELKAYVKADDASKKSIVIVYDQGTFSNKSQASLENKIVPKLASLLTEALNSKDATFWANFETSPSLASRIQAEVINTAIKGGAKGKKIPTKAKSNSKASISIKGFKNKGSNSESIVGNNKKLQLENKRDASSNQNWFRLIPIINAKLNDTVAKNMSTPRLNNRTDRLAQSARVVGVEQTPQGYPSFIFDYERDPYDVFDRTLGRAPWNTPQRDPRALVDMSVREIVREMAIGRFFTRRAQ